MVILARHGDRAPLYQFPWDSIGKKEKAEGTSRLWPQGYGQLTKVGSLTINNIYYIILYYIHHYQNLKHELHYISVSNLIFLEWKKPDVSSWPPSKHPFYTSLSKQANQCQSNLCTKFTSRSVSSVGSTSCCRISSTGTWPTWFHLGSWCSIRSSMDTNICVHNRITSNRQYVSAKFPMSTGSSIVY